MMNSTKSQGNESHGNNVFVLIEQFFPIDGKSEKILEIAKKSSKGIYGMKGLLQAKVLKLKTESGPVCNITTWESEDYFKAFMKSDAVKDLYKWSGTSDHWRTLFDNCLPAEKSRARPLISVIIPPASCTIIDPAA